MTDVLVKNITIPNWAIYTGMTILSNLFMASYMDKNHEQTRDVSQDNYALIARFEAKERVKDSLVNLKITNLQLEVKHIRDSVREQELINAQNKELNLLILQEVKKLSDKIK